MGEYIKVTPEELKESAATVSDLSRSLANKYEQIFASVEQLRSDWNGEGYEAFYSRINGFKGDLNALQTLMELYSIYLDNASINYFNAEAKILRDLQDMTSGRV